MTARGTLRRREMVLFRIRTDEGLTGLGEAVPLSLRGGTALTQVVWELEQVAKGDSLVEFFERGPSLEVSSLDEIDPRLDLTPPARAAVLTAIADLWLQVEEARAGLGRPVRCNATLVAGEPAAVAEEALSWQAEGYKTFKLKLGAGDDVGQVEAVREALGPEAKIRVDANGAWSLADATTVLRALEPLEIELAEQPVVSPEEAAQLAELTSIPLAGDESIVTRADAEEAANSGAFALAGLKISKIGGYVTGLEIAQELSCYATSALDGPVGIAEGARLANGLNVEPTGDYDRAHGLATQRLFASTIAAVESELRGGMLYPPPGEGLGIVIDEQALQAHRL